jgi:hypothetical protein
MAALTAGCTGGSDPAKGPDEVPQLQATETTGVIRAVVVDEAVRPIAGVNVSVAQGGGQPAATAITDADGFAGFEGLQAGTYFLKATRRGYLDAQQSVDVVAGVGDPKVSKLLLQRRAGDLAFYQEFKIDGFLECSATIGNWCFIANFYPCLVEQTAGQPCTGNLTNDNSYFVIDAPLRGLQRVPDWLQVEMVWDSTQALGSSMDVRLDFLSDGGVTIDNSTEEEGPSPLLVDVNGTELQENKIGTDRFLAIETFHGGLTGAAVEQRFTDFVHIFYGYAPPEGWRFSEDGTVPPPP